MIPQMTIQNGLSARPPGVTSRNVFLLLHLGALGIGWIRVSMWRVLNGRLRDAIPRGALPVFGASIIVAQGEESKSKGNEKQKDHEDDELKMHSSKTVWIGVEEC
jgi:hypothetical protein